MDSSSNINTFSLLEDLPLVLTSITCFITFIVYGAGAASLGAALPSLADDFHSTTAHLGIAFTSRGIGYFIGTIVSAALLRIDNLPCSKEFMTAASVALFGLSAFLVLYTDYALSVALLLFGIQGIGAGGIDTMGNCLLPEVWGRRIQPWMQAMHACFGIGGIIGPAIVGSMNYRITFTLVFLASLTPLLWMYGGRILFINKNRSNSTSSIFSIYEKVSDNSSHPLRNVNEPQENSNPIHSTSKITDMEMMVSQEKSVIDYSNNNTTTTSTKIPPPLYIRLLVTFFFFIYVGAETGYAGWIPTYVLAMKVTNNYEHAAYLSSIFWAFLTLGRLSAIVVAIYSTATIMIRTLLFLMLIGGILCILFLNSSYTAAMIVSGYMGLALSCVFPVMMTLFEDYGYEMDSSTTSMFVIGATIGESAVPAMMGWLAAFAGYQYIPRTVCFLCLSMFFIYVIVHRESLQIIEQYQATKHSGTNDIEQRSRDDVNTNHQVEVEMTHMFTIDTHSDGSDEEGDQDHIQSPRQNQRSVGQNQGYSPDNTSIVCIDDSTDI